VSALVYLREKSTEEDRLLIHGHWSLKAHLRDLKRGLRSLRLMTLESKRD